MITWAVGTHNGVFQVGRQPIVSEVDARNSGYQGDGCDPERRDGVEWALPCRLLETLDLYQATPSGDALSRSSLSLPS